MAVADLYSGESPFTSPFAQTETAFDAESTGRYCIIRLFDTPTQVAPHRCKQAGRAENSQGREASLEEGTIKRLVPLLHSTFDLLIAFKVVPMRFFWVDHRQLIESAAAFRQTAHRCDITNWDDLWRLRPALLRGLSKRDLQILYARMARLYFRSIQKTNQSTGSVVLQVFFFFFFDSFQNHEKKPRGKAAKKGDAEERVSRRGRKRRRGRVRALSEAVDVSSGDNVVTLSWCRR